MLPGAIEPLCPAIIKGNSYLKGSGIHRIRGLESLRGQKKACNAFITNELDPTSYIMSADFFRGIRVV
jgi:hypothetical protein